MSYFYYLCQFNTLLLVLFNEKKIEKEFFLHNLPKIRFQLWVAVELNMLWDLQALFWYGKLTGQFIWVSRYVCNKTFRRKIIYFYITPWLTYIFISFLKEFHIQIYVKHCIKSVCIRSYSGPYFPAFGLIWTWFEHADLNMQSGGFIVFHIKTLLSFDLREPITNDINLCLVEVTKSLSGIGSILCI